MSELHIHDSEEVSESVAVAATVLQIPIAKVLEVMASMSISPTTPLNVLQLQGLIGIFGKIVIPYQAPALVPGRLQVIYVPDLVVLGNMYPIISDWRDSTQSNTIIDVRSKRNMLYYGENGHPVTAFAYVLEIL